jgi:hypothetical protein
VHLGEHDLLRVRTDAEKYLLMAVLNHVACGAFVGSTTSSQGPRGRPGVKMARLDAHVY